MFLEIREASIQEIPLVIENVLEKVFPSIQVKEAKFVEVFCSN